MAGNRSGQYSLKVISKFSYQTGSNDIFNDIAQKKTFCLGLQFAETTIY